MSRDFYQIKTDGIIYFILFSVSPANPARHLLLTEEEFPMMLMDKKTALHCSSLLTPLPLRDIYF